MIMSILPLMYSDGTTVSILTNTNTNIPWTGNGSFNNAVVSNDVIIQGDMLCVNYHMTDAAWSQSTKNPDDVKRILVNLLADELWQKNYIEFTKMHDINTSTHKFHARIFVVPDTQVRILRQNGYNSIAR